MVDPGFAPSTTPWRPPSTVGGFGPSTASGCCTLRGDAASTRAPSTSTAWWSRFGDLVANRVNTVFKGTAVVDGRATAIVVATGMAKALGGVVGLLQAHAPPTPLQRRARCPGTAARCCRSERRRKQPTWCWPTTTSPRSSPPSVKVAGSTTTSAGSSATPSRRTPAKSGSCCSARAGRARRQQAAAGCRARHRGSADQPALPGSNARPAARRAARLGRSPRRLGRFHHRPVGRRARKAAPSKGHAGSRKRSDRGRAPAG